MTPFRHLLDTESLDPAIARQLLARAQRIAGSPAAWGEVCRDRLLVNVFYEPSTRTRVSFEIAARRLGMQVVNVSALGSSVSKGESLLDTFSTLQAMEPDVMVIRHPDERALEPLAALAQQLNSDVRLVNAGDGSHAHPTQALLDLMTLQAHFPRLEEIRVLIAGDLRHSRVTRSGVVLMHRLGVGEIRLAAPGGLEAGPDVRAHARCFDSLDAALAGVDAVMMLRVQRERLAGVTVPEAADYHKEWGLTPARLALAAPGCIVLHPGPMNRGTEIATEVADGPQSVILEQVRNGVFMRMAVISLLLDEQP